MVDYFLGLSPFFIATIAVAFLFYLYFSRVRKGCFLDYVKRKFKVKSKIKGGGNASIR